MRRCSALTGNCIALLASLALSAPASASVPPAQPLSIVDAPFVGVDNATLKTLLSRLGATLSWHRAARDVLITTASHEVIAFTVGDRSYREGSVAAQARNAPYLKAGIPYLPLGELLSSLSLTGFPQGRVVALEPLLSSLDIRTAPEGTTIVAQAAIPLAPRLLSQSSSQLIYEFDGVGSTVSGTRSVNAGGVRDVSVTTSGRLATAKTLVTLHLLGGAVASAARSDDGRDFALSVAVRPEPAPSAELSGTLVTAVDVTPAQDSFTVTIAVSGDATYVWHRLLAPDNRFWIDVMGARASTIARNDRWQGRVTGVRVSQQSPATVRVALSLASEQTIDVVPSASGIRIVVGNDVAADAPRSGSGSIGSVVASAVETPLPPPEPIATALLTPAPYHPAYVPTNPRLIVIDPGHGGDDPGTVYHGAQEKTFTLDIAQRLRDILVARGWQVRMTHASDVAVDPSAQTDHDELQARVDVANDNGARLFISIHVNAYSDQQPSGVTSFYSKPEDVPLARDVENAIARGAGEQNDGIVKSKLYVTFHARMPAMLVETAFITNPGDLARLESPSWRQRVAQAMADGIETYARENPVPPAARE